MKKASYEFSSTHAELPKQLSDKIIAWGRDVIPESDVFRDPEDPSFGRENDIHVTLLYGIHDTNPDGLKELLSKQDPFVVRLGNVTTFTNNDKFDVIKIDAQGDGLFRLNQLFKANLEHTSKFPNYRPHITIAYVRKGKGPKSGSGYFKGEKFIVDEIVFSSSSGKKYRLPLNDKHDS